MKFIQLLIATFSLILAAACGGPQHIKALDPHYSEASLAKLRSFHSTHVINDSIANLHAVSFNETDSHPVVMIHGTPGSWSTFSFVLGNTKLQKTNQLISVDRLDWGQSLNSDPKKQSPGFDEQVDAIAAMIRNTTDKPVILLGHSLGASLAPNIAIKHPDLVKGMILVAGTVDPNLGKPRWFNKIARWKVTQWFLPKELINSNKEVYALKPGLHAVESSWQTLNIPIAVIQGLKDRLVFPENVEYVQKQYADKPELLDVVTLPKSGHFIPWEHTDEIINAIYRMNEKFDENTLPSKHTPQKKP